MVHGRGTHCSGLILQGHLNKCPKCAEKLLFFPKLFKNSLKSTSFSLKSSIERFKNDADTENEIHYSVSVLGIQPGYNQERLR